MALSRPSPMQVGFAVVVRDEHVEFRMFGRQRADRPALVAYCEEGDNRAVLMGRLYYRHDLRSRLGGADTLAQSSDAALALASYRKFGLEGVERLEGDFALAISDRKERRLVASRDPMGGYPIYWLQRDGTVAVATGLRPLVDLLPTSSSVDVGFLGETLMLPFAEIDYFEGTAFEGIGRLVPGSLLTVDLPRRTVVRREFWNWPDRVEDPGKRDLLLCQLRWMRGRRVGPVASNTRTSRGTPKQRHRILEIGVQQRLMFDQGESGPPHRAGRQM